MHMTYNDTSLPSHSKATNYNLQLVKFQNLKVSYSFLQLCNHCFNDKIGLFSHINMWNPYVKREENQSLNVHLIYIQSHCFVPIFDQDQALSQLFSLLEAQRILTSIWSPQIFAAYSLYHKWMYIWSNLGWFMLALCYGQQTHEV